MKRYLIQLAALSFLAFAAGCQKERGGIDNPQNSQTVAVNISIDGLAIDAATSPAAGDAATNRAAGDAASTRAVVNDITDITTHGFTIAGYYTEGGVAPDPVTDGTFDANIATTKPNVFDYQGGGIYSGDAVLVPVLKDGKYEVVLSKWQLRENSYLSYVAWASKVAPGVDDAVVDNPITVATKNGDVGKPFITVISGTTTKSYNTDVVAAKSIDNVNDVVRSAVYLDFKHVMTKLKFSVKNDSRVAMTLTGARVLFMAGGVSRGAKYTFDGTPSRVGTWSGHYTYSEATYPVTLTPTDLAPMGVAVPLDELLIIPQKPLIDGAISVELTYTMLNGSYTRTVPLKARTYEQNTSYTYEIALNETTISINEGRIGAWIDTKTGDLPYVAGARDPNVQLLLDAYDAPYTHTDGNQYWLDRSGWNRHCKLVGGVTYDVAGKFYKFSDSPINATYLEVPPTFSATTGATFETIVRSTRPSTEANTAQDLFDFASGSEMGDRVMFCHFHYFGSEDYYFDAGGLNRVTAKIPLSLYREFAMYSFSKSMSGQYMRRNLVYYNNTISTGVNAAVDLSRANYAKIGYCFKGDIKYFKVLSTAKTTIDANDYAALSKRHKVKNTDYVDEGLLFDLRGMDAPVDGRWYERITKASTPTSGISYDNYWKEYTINNSVSFDVTNYYKGTTLPELTIEFTGSMAGFGTGSPAAPVSWGEVGAFRFHEMVDQYQWMSPYSWGKAFYRIYIPEKLQLEKCVYSCSRKNIGLNAELIVHQSNTLRGTGTGRDNGGSNGYSVIDVPPTICTLGGGLSFKCSATRLYNRKLTNEERLWNYNLDKKVYEGIP